MKRNALIERLDRYLVLNAEERAALHAAEGQELRLAAGEALMREGGPSNSLFIVQHGWLHESMATASPDDDRRRILRFDYPGDLIGTSSIAWAQAATTLTAVTDCIVLTMPKPVMGELFREQPRLAGLLYALAAAENVAMADRLASISGTDAVFRLAALLLDIFARLRVTAGGVIDSFDMPLTQQDLADAVGLTKVHVNRTLAEMERREMIARVGKRYRIVDAAELMRFTGFVDRYAEIETDWLPTG